MVAHSLPALKTAVVRCKEQGWRVNWLGAGTRTAARDGEHGGAVIRLGTGFAEIEPDGDGWRVGAAVPMPALLSAAVAAGRGGLTGHAWTPGSVGASLVLDTGWSPVVDSVTVLKRRKPVEVTLAEARKGKGVLVLGARLTLPNDPERALRSALRAQSQPRPGSWYQGARRKQDLRTLIRSVRLQMVRLRQVAIPGEAPELLVNLGEGTATDLQMLHRSVVERVKKVRGEQLTGRMRWIGSAH